MTKKRINSKYLFQQTEKNNFTEKPDVVEKKVVNLEKTIQNIKHELELKTNIRFHLNKYVMFIKSLKPCLHLIIKQLSILEEKQQNLKKELSLLEACIAINTKTLVVRMERCDIKRRKLQTKNTNVKQYGKLDGMYWRRRSLRRTSYR